MEFLDFTSFDARRVSAAGPPFETAFHARIGGMADGWETADSPPVYRLQKAAPSRHRKDRCLFILVFLKTYALQVVHGRLFGMVQAKANPWIHVLLPVLLAALRTSAMPGPLPSRALANARYFRGRRRTVVVPAGGGIHPCSSHPSRRAGLPPFAHDGTDGASSAPGPSSTSRVL